MSSTTTTAPIASWADGRLRAGRPDLVLVGSVVLLAVLGVIMVYSASRARLAAIGAAETFEMQRQAIFALVGAAAFAAASVIPSRTLRSLTPLAYAGAVLLLLALFPLADARPGAQRWISIGTFQLQPSEFAKPAVILALAAMLSATEDLVVRWSTILRAAAVVGIPSVLIFLQPDLGTMLVFGFVAVAMLFVAGTTLRQLATLVTVALVGTVVVLSLGVLADYQLERLTGFLDPSSNLATANYNQNQSKVTIGSGQILGKGLFEGEQTNLSFVPAQSTDFIFTALAEQLGFVGGATVLFLYAVILWRLFGAAANARNSFGRLLCVGVASMIGFHVFVNVGMTMGMMPVTGLPLPLLSAGGSALVSTMAALGVAHSVWLQRSPVPGDRHIL